ncbi:hypothetical protein JOD24_000294 [Kroppenstedtia sanguinis]
MMDFSQWLTAGGVAASLAWIAGITTWSTA